MYGRWRCLALLRVAEEDTLSPTSLNSSLWSGYFHHCPTSNPFAGVHRMVVYRMGELAQVKSDIAEPASAANGG